jgi:hypothetical protein
MKGVTPAWIVPSASRARSQEQFRTTAGEEWGEMFILQKLHPGDTPERFGTWISSDWSEGMAWGWVESFVHSEQVLRPAFFSAVTHKVKMPTMETSYMFLQVISKTVPSLPLSLSIPFLADYSSSLPGAATVAGNSCTAQTPSAVQIHRIKTHSAPLRVPQTTSHDSNYGSNLKPMGHGVQLCLIHTKSNSQSHMGLKFSRSLTVVD